MCHVKCIWVMFKIISVAFPPEIIHFSNFFAFSLQNDTCGKRDHICAKRGKIQKFFDLNLRLVLVDLFNHKNIT